MQSDQARKGILCMAACAALWSIAGILIKLIPWNALVIAGGRSLVAAMVFLVYIKVKRIKIVVNKNALLIMGFTAVNFLLFVRANKLTTAANAIVLEFTSPVFILLISALVLRQKYKKQDILAVAIVTVGIALFFVDQLNAGGLLGNLCALGAGLTVALMYIVAGGATEEERFSGLFFGHLLTAAVGLPFLFFTKNPMTATAIAALLALGAVQLGIPYVLYAIALKYCPPLQCSLIAAIEPLLNPVWVFLLDGEAPGTFALIGGAIVIVAITAWSMWKEKQKA